jgi:hypothetical protein
MAQLRRLIVVLCSSKNVLHLPQNRNMMSSTFRAEKVMEELKNNPYYEKYSKKISAFQKFVVYQIELLMY